MSNSFDPRNSSCQLRSLGMTNGHTTRRTLLAGACGVGAVSLVGRSFARSSAKTQPDIVFIMADDMGFADLSCYGQTGYRTPVLDRLASEGLKFTQAYANSAVCSATRTALATGRYQQRFAIGLEEPVGPTFKQGLPAGTPTIASRFKALGYRTGLVGKWHVGDVPRHGPHHYGYDHFFGISAGSADYFGHGGARADPKPKRGGLFSNDEPVEREGYLTYLLAEEAGRWIGKGDAPFFLSLHFNAPHWPWEGPDDIAHSQQLKVLRDSSGGSLETYAKMVQAMDEAIGRLLKQLAATRRGRDTIVIFTSDNGGERYSDVWPLTGVKGELLEGGIRVPLIIRWPGHIRPGSETDQVMTSMDFMPTLLAAAGGTPLGPDESDGMNLLPQILRQAPVAPRTLFWRYNANDQAAVRDGDWKYLKLGGKEHLFNLASDPRERAELAEVHPDRFAALKAKYAAWDAKMLPYGPENKSEDVKEVFPDRY